MQQLLACTEDTWLSDVGYNRKTASQQNTTTLTTQKHLIFLKREMMNCRFNVTSPPPSPCLMVVVTPIFSFLELIRIMETERKASTEPGTKNTIKIQ
jgi:hypothetical protein